MRGKIVNIERYFIICYFNHDKYNGRKAKVYQYVANLQEKYGEERINIEIEDQYYNMREKIEPVMEVVDIAAQAMNNLGITTIIEPIRGGTDGYQLSFLGLPTPNNFTVIVNFHV